MAGLVLAGGGAKGSYQIGAYLAIKKCHIKINGVVGSSIGAFNAAMIVSGKDKELYEFWKDINVGAVLNFNQNYIDSVNNQKLFKTFIYGFEQISSILKNKGIEVTKLKELLTKMIDEEKIRKSKMDYGIVTVRLNGMKPVYIFKEDMVDGKMTDYILASCNIPIFKVGKCIDNHYYIDGGFYDVNPINMLLKKGYDKIYSIDLKSIGIKQKTIDSSKVITIKPSRRLGSILSVNKNRINENIKLGYYDTLKVLKKYDGDNYIFKKRHLFFYNLLVKNIDKELYNKCKSILRAKNNKELVLKALEYVMIKKEYTYFNVYRILPLIKKIKKDVRTNDSIYNFVKKLSLF